MASLSSFSEEDCLYIITIIMAFSSQYLQRKRKLSNNPSSDDNNINPSRSGIGLENSLILLGGNPPTLDSVDKGGEGFVVRYREYLGDITSNVNISSNNSSAFKLSSFLLQPGLVASFP